MAGGGRIAHRASARESDARSRVVRVASESCMSLGRRPLFVRQAEESLQEQLEPELVVLRRDQSSIHQVIEPDQEPPGVGTQGSADDGAGEPTDKCAKDKR